MPPTVDQLQKRLNIVIFFLVLSFLFTGVTYWRHWQLKSWAATTNDATVPDYDQGNLTSYLGDLADKISHHIAQTPEAGHGHPDQHKEPPPPPVW